MPEYAWIIALILLAVYVCSHIRATLIAQKVCGRTCRLLDMQSKAMEEEMKSGRY